MVSKLKHFEKDPMHPHMDRGRGWYYNRGKLRGFTHNRDGVYWSKYSESIDAKKPHLPRKTSNVTKSETWQPHKGDYKTRKVKNPRTGRYEVKGGNTKRLPTTPDKNRGFF